MLEARHYEGDDIDLIEQNKRNAKRFVREEVKIESGAGRDPKLLQQRRRVGMIGWLPIPKT